MTPKDLNSKYIQSGIFLYKIYTYHLATPHSAEANPTIVINYYKAVKTYTTSFCFESKSVILHIFFCCFSQQKRVRRFSIHSFLARSR
jgi:hypothetical protein